MVEIKEAPVPVRAWDIHPSGNLAKIMIHTSLYERFPAVSGRPMRVELSNGQIVIVRAKK